LPEALRNYLVRLGWSHGDDEIFSTEQMIKWFGLDNIGRSAARFDFSKLENLNGQYIRNSDDRHLIEAIKASIHEYEGCEDLSGKLEADDWRRFEMAMPGLKERAKTLVELVNSARYLFVKRPLSFDKKATKILNDDARSMLRQLTEEFGKLSDWSIESTEQCVRDFADAKELKLGKIAQPLRAALTGGAVSPGIFDVLFVLGKEEALGRLADIDKPGS